ncbi:MAG: SRPBCC domain-containing protein [Stappiaceae bacterium]
MTDLSLTVSRKFAAPAKQIFDAWLDPAMLARFMTPAPGMTVPKAETDPVEGGRFDIVMKMEGNELPHAGTYKEISPYSRLVFTWESPYSVPESTVTLNFVEVDGGTEVTLTHDKFPNEEARDNHEGGWSAILEKLDALAA